MYSPNTVVSYAQNSEDIILKTIFKSVKKGFYVDIGANHPVRHSVTKIFYDEGWHGINIEPNPRLHKLLAEERPKDINLNVGIASEEGELTLRLYHSKDGLEGLSTFSDKMKTENLQNANEDNKNFSDISVPVKKLSKVLTDNATKIVHFMKVDVEGLEYEVLASNDWERHRPHVICIEFNHLMNEWHNILSDAKYKRVYTDGLNEYFIAKEMLNKYDVSDLAERVVTATNDALKAHQYEQWSQDVKKLKGLETSVEEYNKQLDQLEVEFKRASSLTLKDQSLRYRIKRAVLGLTVDWIRFKKGKS